MTELATAAEIKESDASFRDWIAVLSAMLGAFMAVIDILITNASLREIQGALGATLVEGSWITTAYLVAEIIIIPLTVWLTELFGIRRLTLGMSCGFIISSLLCSSAWNLESMIVFRAMQGLFGGAFIPLGFTLVLLKLPMHQRPIGMALFAVTATFAPAIGPAIGGWLTENLGWKYLFYINIPPGIIMIVGLMYGLEKRAMDWSKLREADYGGIVTMALGLGCLEVMLEEGYRHEWFESRFITTLAIVSFVSLTTFIIIQFSRPKSVINLRVFKDRNFTLSCIAAVGLGIGLYGSIYALPLYIIQVQDYSPLQIGVLMMWMAVPQLIVIPLVPILIRYISPRTLCAFGLILFGYSCFATGFLNPDVAGLQLVPIQFVRALGQPFIFITASLIATSFIDKQDAGSASSLFNMLRNLSGAIFIAVTMTMLQNDTSRYYEYLREHVTYANPQALARLDMLTASLGNSDRALSVLVSQVQNQASILAFNEAFHIMGCALIISVIAIMLTKKTKGGLNLTGGSH